MAKTVCRYVRNNLFDYLDGNLDNKIASSVEAHLASCRVCRKELERCRATLALLASAKVEPPSDLVSSVMARIAAETGDAGKETDAKANILRPRRRVLTRRFGTFVAAAALVVVVAVGWRVLPAFMNKTGSTDLAAKHDMRAEGLSAEIFPKIASSETSQETLAGLGNPDSAQSSDDIVMFSLPSADAGQDDSADAATDSRSGVAVITDEGGYVPGYEGSPEAPADNAPPHTEPGGLKMLAPSAEQLIEQYAPEFLDKAQQVVIIRTGSPTEIRTDASASVSGEGFAAYFIDGSEAAIAAAEKLASELDGSRYGEPGTPMVWVEIYG